MWLTDKVKIWRKERALRRLEGSLEVLAKKRSDAEQLAEDMTDLRDRAENYMAQNGGRLAHSFVEEYDHLRRRAEAHRGVTP